MKIPSLEETNHEQRRVRDGIQDRLGYWIYKRKKPSAKQLNAAQMGNVVMVVVLAHHGLNFRTSLPLAVSKQIIM
jgi:hypothetical protein